MCDQSRLMTRTECPPDDVPCMHVTCRYHLWTAARWQTPHRGTISIEAAWGDLNHTCALRIADAGPHTAEQVAAIMGLSTIRVRKIETRALNDIRLLNPDLAETFERFMGYAPIGPSRTTCDAQPSGLPALDRPKANTRDGKYRDKKAGDLLATCAVCGRVVPQYNRAGQPSTTCASKACQIAWARSLRRSQPKGAPLQRYSSEGKRDTGTANLTTTRFSGGKNR